MKSHQLYHGRGCCECNNTGYKGRAAILEIFTVDRDIARLIADNATPGRILESARNKGFITMLDDARRKVFDGITSPQEAVRVLVGAY